MRRNCEGIIYVGSLLELFFGALWSSFEVLQETLGTMHLVCPVRLFCVSIAQVMPKLEQAMKEVDQLDKDDISVIKSFKKPPAAVELVMNAICLLFGLREKWDNSKALLGKMTFMRELKEFDKEHIPKDVLKSLRK